MSLPRTCFSLQGFKQCVLTRRSSVRLLPEEMIDGDPPGGFQSLPKPFYSWWLLEIDEAVGESRGI